MTPFGIFFATTMLLATGVGGVIGFIAVVSGNAPAAFFCGCLFATPWAFALGSMHAKKIERKATQ